MSANVSSIDAPMLRKGAKAWLEARGLDSDLCDRLGLTSRTGRDGVGEILIPYERAGAPLYAKVRKIEPKGFYREPSDSDTPFWRVDAIADQGLASEPLIITEGEFDAIAAIQAGFWRTVSVPDGAPAKSMEDGTDLRASRKYAFVESARGALEGVAEIIVAADADGPGAAMLADLTALLGPARCKFVAYPPDCKDLNDVLRVHGVEKVRECIADARWVRVVGVHQFLDLPPLPPLDTWRPDIHKPIDELLTLCPGHVSVWTGIPGHGKSSLLNAVAWSIAARDGIKIAHGTFESTPQREYLEDAIGFRTGAPPAAATAEEVDAAKGWLHRNVIFLVSDGFTEGGKDEFFDADLEWFFEAARSAVVRFGCRIVVLDPWSQIEHARPNNEPETLYVQRSLRRAKMFARAFGVHVAIVAHPTKQRKNEDGTYAMPEGYDISGSAHWYNGVDLGVTIHRAPPLILNEDGDWVPDRNSSRVLVRAWKKKNHRIMGSPGEAYASFDPRTGRYFSAEHWEEKTQPKRHAEPVVPKRERD